MTEPTVAIVDADTALQRQTADLLTQVRQRRADSNRFFEKYEELVARHRTAGVRWAIDFDPVEKAAYDVWRHRGVGEAPVPPIGMLEAGDE
jgi:hypothetical protein